MRLRPLCSPNSSRNPLQLACLHPVACKYDCTIGLCHETLCVAHQLHAQQHVAPWHGAALGTAHMRCTKNWSDTSLKHMVQHRWLGQHQHALAPPEPTQKSTKTHGSAVVWMAHCTFCSRSDARMPPQSIRTCGTIRTSGYTQNRVVSHHSLTTFVKEIFCHAKPYAHPCHTHKCLYAQSRVACMSGALVVCARDRLLFADSQQGTDARVVLQGLRMGAETLPPGTDAGAHPHDLPAATHTQTQTDRQTHTHTHTRL